MIPIVVVAFNRARALERLLDSIECAHYTTNNIPLIISIDKGDNKDVLTVAENFGWSHGAKEVRYQKENLKLRKHILKCGDITEEYGSVIILEDDLYVSPCFYDFACQALEFVKNDSRIGGVSLYSHAYNVNVFEPFSPILDGSDNWYFQFASSWGQAWTKEQWQGFKRWYVENENKDLAGSDIPTTVTNWSPNSWLKYFIKYLIVSDKYFLYPRLSLTTNFGAAGTHVATESTMYQVPLSYNQRQYSFSTLDESQAVYDAFFENLRLNNYLGVENCTIDLYGSKPKPSKGYILSSRIYNNKVIKSYARSMRPMDANIVYSIPGEDFFLYDTTIEEKNNRKRDEIRAVQYRIRSFKSNTYLVLAKMFLNSAVKTLKKHLHIKNRMR